MAESGHYNPVFLPLIEPGGILSPQRNPGLRNQVQRLPDPPVFFCYNNPNPQNSALHPDASHSSTLQPFSQKNHSAEEFCKAIHSVL